MSRSRSATAAVLVLIPVIALAIAGPSLGSRVGDRIASHWSLSGPADGFSSTWPLFGAVTAIAAVLAVLSLLLIARPGSASRLGVSIMSLPAGLGALVWIISAWATADAAYDEAITLGARAVTFLVPVLIAIALYLLVPAAARIADPDLPQPVALPLGPGDRLSWAGETGSRGFLAVGVVLAIACLVSLVLAALTDASAPLLVAIITGIVTLPLLAIAHARLTVDRRGIRLTSALFRIPIMRVSLENIDQVSVETIEPMRWGGWGLRFSTAGVAYITRRGPGIVITRRRGGASAITIDDAEGAATAAASLLAAR